jgi:hypothetical protein
MDGQRHLVVLDVGPVLFAGALARVLTRRGVNVVDADGLADEVDGPIHVAVVQRDGAERHDADVVITLHDFESLRVEDSVGVVQTRGGRPAALSSLDALFDVINDVLRAPLSLTEDAI